MSQIIIIFLPINIQPEYYYAIKLERGIQYNVKITSDLAKQKIILFSSKFR